MGFNAVDAKKQWNGQTVDANGSAQVMLYDQFGNPIAYKSMSAPAVSVAGVPMLGVEGDTVVHIPRVSSHATLRTTSESLLWHDAFEGSTINSFWQTSSSTMAASQTTGVLTLNNASSIATGAYYILSSKRQFPKYPRIPLFARFRANLSANPNSHTLAELGFGLPTTATAVISNGAFFRWTAAGTLVVVTSYGGAENVSSVLLAQGSISTTSYYYYDVIMDDGLARFIVSDSSGDPVVDVTLRMPVSSPTSMSVSHIPSFARVYADVTGGGTPVQLKIASHTVHSLDSLTSLSWSDQSGLAMRPASINPVTYAQTGASMNAAPATITPSNTAPGYSALGGEWAIALTVASEQPLSVFSFQIPAPYTFMLTGIGMPFPVLATNISTTGFPTLEWLAVANCASGNLSTGGGQQIALSIWTSYGFDGLAGNFLSFIGSGLAWQPRVPIACLPGTFLHICYKVFTVTAVATAGITRGALTVDGYFM